MANQKVWSKFNKTVKGNVVSFSIQETQNDKIELIVDLIIKYQVPEDPFCTAAGLDKSADALKEYKELLVNMIGEAKHQIDVVSLDDGTIIGASVMALTKKDDPEFDFEQLKFKNTELEKLFKIFSVLYKKFNVLKNNAANSSYDDWGIVVLPDYRDLGIEEEIIKARMAISKDKNVPQISGWMFTPDRIQAAERSGWKSASEFSFAELAKETGVSFTGSITSGKLMFAKL